MPPVRKRKASEGVQRATAALRGTDIDSEAGSGGAVEKLAQMMANFQEEMRGRMTRLEQSSAPANTATPSISQTEPEPVQHRAVQEITGMTDQVTTNCVPVDLQVGKKLRSKIVNNEAIDFAKLIPREFGQKQNGQKKKKRNESSDEEGDEFVDLSERKWIQGWNIFLQIYASAHPTKLQGLTAHFQQVLDLMAAKANWQLYDQLTRLMIEEGKLEWGVTSQTLVTKATLQPFRPTSMQKHSVPKSFCIEYHNKGFCQYHTQCKYKHECFRCSRGSHPAKACRGGGAPTATPKTNQKTTAATNSGKSR